MVALLVFALLVVQCASLSRCQWANDFLTVMSPRTNNTVTAMLGWMAGEGSRCQCNPLDTEDPYGGSTNCNSVGVQDFLSESDGLHATRGTLLLSYYNNIRALFAANADSLSIASAIAASPWGTHDAVTATRYCLNNYAACCNTNVVCSNSNSSSSWAWNPPSSDVQARIQRGLKARGRYNGPSDGVWGINSIKGIQQSAAVVGYSGPIDGVPGPNTCHFVQVFAAKFGGYTGPIDSIMGPHSWDGFAAGLEAGHKKRKMKIIK